MKTTQLPMGLRLLLCLTGLLQFVRLSKAAPNIIFILADDFGYNDISWHNPDIISPNLESLARGGIILEQAYVQPLCTPTRAALLTGYYPIHTGRQSGALFHQEPRGLYTNFTLLPEYLNTLGYKSHMIGKWHLGYCDEAYTPDQRGFETFNGFYLANQDYYYHHPAAFATSSTGFDYRDNETVDFAANTTYSGDLFTDNAGRLIESHATNNPDDPLFLYLAFPNPHYPLMVPEEYENMYSHIKNKNRRIFSGMVTAMDDAVGTIIQSLKDNGLYDDSIIVFSADNGAQNQQGGSNFPLRGNKGTLWEGGTRAAAFIHAPAYIQNPGTYNYGLHHVTDWMPTLFTAAGGDSSSLSGIDGVDQWQALTNSGPSARLEMLYNMYPVDRSGGEGSNVTTESPAPMSNVNAALRMGHMKLIVGDAGSDEWIPPPDKLGFGDDDFNLEYDMQNEEEEFRKDRYPTLVQLYNITDDPYEIFDLADRHPDIVSSMLAHLEEMKETMIEPFISPEVDEGDPNNFGGVYSPGWCVAQPEI